MNRLLKRVLFVCLLATCFTSIHSNAQITFSNIDDKPASTWQWCNSCASPNHSTAARGGVANVTQSGYTVDGSSLRFDLIPQGCCYGNVFFWNVLTKNISETAVTDDFYAMMDSAGNNNSQAVEFTVEHDLCKINCGQSNEEDFRYIYSVQCDFKGSKLWRLWDGAGNGGSGAWVNSSHSCVEFQPKSFNHFVFHFSRGNQEVTYIDMWINGVQYSFNNATYGIQYDTPNYGGQFLASVQLDGDSTEGGYSLWVDKWNVTY